jgi:hypothetical protein
MKEVENNFQIKNIIYKMKKIKKKKNNPKNLQNIETLEVLQNIPKPTKKENIIEGLGLDNNYEYGLPKDSFEGGDDINSESGNIISFEKQFIDFINEVYTNLILVNCFFAFFITNSIGDYNTKIENISYSFIKSITNIQKEGNNEDPFNGGDEGIDPNLIKDSNVIYQYICIFEAFLSAYLLTLIWFYNIFYNYYVNKPYSNIFDYLYKDSIIENTNKFSDFILFFFGYAFLILENIRYFFEKLLPKIGYSIFNKPFLYILLFVIIYNFNHKFLSQFKNFLINMINGNYKSFSIIVISFIIIKEYISSFYSSDAKIRGYLNRLSGNFFQFFFDFIKEIIRILIIIFINVPLGVILCILYFFFISFFSIFESFKELNNILNFIRSDINDVINSDSCNTTKTLWDHLKNSFLYLSMGFYNNLIFVIVFIYCVFILSNNVKLNYYLTLYLQLIHIPILILSIVLFLVLIMKYKSIDNNLTFIELLFHPNFLGFSNYINSTMKIIGLLMIILILFIIISTFSIVNELNISDVNNDYYTSVIDNNKYINFNKMDIIV